VHVAIIRNALRLADCDIGLRVNGDRINDEGIAFPVSDGMPVEGRAGIRRVRTAICVMRRSLLPSDSPSIVTLPGVNNISIALCVTSIHAGIASGRQFTNKGGGRPAFSSAYWNSICAAALAFHGGGLVFICAF